MFQEVRALHDYLRLGDKLFFWRRADGQEVDLVIYGERGLIALEVKRGANVMQSDLKGLRSFLKDYPSMTNLL